MLLTHMLIFGTRSGVVLAVLLYLLVCSTRDVAKGGGRISGMHACTSLGSSGLAWLAGALLLLLARGPWLGDLPGKWNMA